MGKTPLSFNNYSIATGPFPLYLIYPETDWEFVVAVMLIVPLADDAPADNPSVSSENSNFNIFIYFSRLHLHNPPIRSCHNLSLRCALLALFQKPLLS